MEVKILVAAHKNYSMPKDDIYLPIHVGKELNNVDLGFIGDNTGDNISVKNPNYCELTAIYWAWKNLKADYIGLAHYRRHFSVRRKGGKWESVMNSTEAKELCGSYDIIVPNKRKYYIETNYSHYIHMHNRQGIDLVCEIIKNDYPQYTSACDMVMSRTWAHMFNMFIMRKDYFDKYCEWLFDILFKAEDRYHIHEARIFGYFSELLLDVWIEANGYAYKEMLVRFMERQNWLIKGGKFLKRKFFSK